MRLWNDFNCGMACGIFGRRWFAIHSSFLALTCRASATRRKRAADTDGVVSEPVTAPRHFLSLWGIDMRITFRHWLLSGFSGLFTLALAAPASALQFTVINTNDSGTGSLRSAIAAANASPGTDQIRFNIPSEGVQVISPLTPLPTIADSVSIDGYSQPGTISHAAGDVPPTILIQLDGSLQGSVGVGLGVCANNVTIQGLSVTRFPKHGIALGENNLIADCPGGTGSDNSVINGNFVGLFPDGTTAAGNGLSGIVVFASSGVSIENNVVSSNVVHGIQVGDGNSVQIFNNVIGLDASATLDRGNLNDGVNASTGATSVQIGTLGANWIGYNRNGVVVTAAAGRVNAESNNFINNDTLAIDLSATSLPDGPTGNDALDIDAGGNNLQNFPGGLAASRISTGVTINGTIARAVAGTQSFLLAAYVLENCSAGSRASGKFLGDAPVTTASGPVAAFTVDIVTSEPLPVGSRIGTTLTDSLGNTSEMSLCAGVDAPASNVVTTTADSGAGSLRQAILDANANPGGDIIQFNIPGAGVHVIQPTSALPAITEAVVIDGYSQPGSVRNTLESGDNAVIGIELRGTSAGATPGLRVEAANVQVRGLSITGFNQSGILVGAGLNAYPGLIVVGNFIGVRPNGNTASGNGAGGVDIASARLAILGDGTPGGRNVMAANGANFTSGAQITTRSSVLGSILVKGNYLGTAADGESALVNPRSGILLTGKTNGSRIGGASLSAQNRIAFNTVGIIIASPSSNVGIEGNAIFSNTGLGIDLAPAGFVGDGVTANDLNDGDGGANGLQNFPTLNSVQLFDGGLRVLGSLDRTSASGARDFVLRFYGDALCDPSSHGEGAVFLGEKVVVLDSPSDESFDVRLDASVVAGDSVSATATAASPDGTSEFSLCSGVTLGDVIFDDGFDP